MTRPLAWFLPAPPPQAEVQPRPVTPPSLPSPPPQQASWLGVPTQIQWPFTEQNKPLFPLSQLPESSTAGLRTSAAGVSSQVRSTMDGLFRLTELSYSQRLSKLDGIYSNLTGLLQQVEQSDLPEGLQTLWFQAIQWAQAQVLSVGQGMLPGGLKADELKALFTQDEQGGQPTARLADQARAKFDEAAKTEITHQLANLKKALSGGNIAFESTTLNLTRDALANLQGLLTLADTSALVQDKVAKLLSLIHEQQGISTRAERQSVQPANTNESPKSTQLETLLFT